MFSCKIKAGWIHEREVSTQHGHVFGTTGSFVSLYFITHFSKPALSRAVVSSFNQFSKRGSTPSRTVGNGHCNNNNRKSNLNYALKRLGQNNPLNKHKWGGGESACDRMQGGGPACVDVPLPDSGICVRLCLILGVRMMMVFIFGKWEYAGGSELLLLK